MKSGVGLIKIGKKEVEYLRNKGRNIFIYRTFGKQYYVEETSFVLELLENFTNELNVLSFGDSFYQNTKKINKSNQDFML